MIPHLGHTEVTVVVAVVAAGMYSKHKTKNGNMKNINVWSACERIYLPDVSLALTFTGLGALKPSVISVSVTDTSTIFMPSTATSATTDSA